MISNTKALRPDLTLKTFQFIWIFNIFNQNETNRWKKALNVDWKPYQFLIQQKREPLCCKNKIKKSVLQTHGIDCRAATLLYKKIVTETFNTMKESYSLWYEQFLAYNSCISYQILTYNIINVNVRLFICLNYCAHFNEFCMLLTHNIKVLCLSKNVVILLIALAIDSHWSTFVSMRV